MIAVALAVFKYWRLILVAAAVAGAIGFIAYIHHLQSAAATAKAHLAAETLVAEKNRAAAEYLVAHQKQMEGLRAKIAAGTVRRTTALNSVIEGITHEPIITVPTAADLNALGDRLRQLDADANH